MDTALDSHVPKVSLDAPRFAEAIKELLRNSSKAISKQNPPKGKICVSTEFIPNKKSLGSGRRSPKSNVVKITIQDDGPGFPENFPLF